jgi:Rps23 Pro-64 3,4-dihydroxylase Tpa1-like proline 4-hydroxylase
MSQNYFSLPIDDMQTTNELRQRYMNNSPYPHIAIDNFLKQEIIEEVHRDFPAVHDEGWIHYLHYNEKKHGLNKMELLPASARSLIHELNTPAFISFLEKITGINNLKADESMEGGGLHQTVKGGFLNIHADFTVHPHKKNWQRRVNILIYMNKDWKDEYGGHLELWSRDMKRCEEKVLPVFNRCVIFNTDADSFHGHPEPLTCPQEMTRKSVALYYFTEEKEIAIKHATNYKPRPGERFKGVLIYLDKKVLSSYSYIKGLLGLDDSFASNFLNSFTKLFKKK